jgi:predicted TIM-barrel fold metal-dependent hydrolase
MKAYAAVDPQLPLAAVPAYARRVEQLGFDGLHIAETIHDSPSSTPRGAPFAPR